MRNLMGTLVFTAAITGGMLLDNWRDYLEESRDYISIAGISKLVGTKGYIQLEENGQVDSGSKMLLMLEAYDADGIESLKIRAGNIISETHTVNQEGEHISEFRGPVTLKAPDGSGDVKVCAEIIDLNGQIKKSSEYSFKISSGN